ncbi:MAG: M1 family metallopeptidase [Flavobacteriales bacterium]|nr:M1 family metallopeptidase [Flavobacteriales bacterium]
MMRPLLLALLLCSAALAQAQLGDVPSGFTHADTLRGSVGPYRAWWNVVGYDVSVRPYFGTRTISGTTQIAFDAMADGQRMQIDLQQPLVVDSILTDMADFKDGAISVSYKAVPFVREGNVVWVDLPQAMRTGEATTITIHYHGVPRAAINPPWDGGWIWKKDAQGNPWVSVACQGLGASVWYPCKDHQSDEPEEGATLRIIVPDSLQGIGNGRLRGTWPNGDGTTTWEWQVSSPINTYNLIPYIGKYAHWNEVYAGADGPLQCDYWVLASNEAKAREQFKQVPEMLGCFEEWLGPYPFYRDGYKLVESPHLGMEHQSAIAYGNGFVNGYRGTDLSGSGHGLKWDYIIIHESGHEWFGNSITTADIADMWVHEGFTDYTETLYTECQQGTEAAENYLVGLRRNIRNDRPIIGPYGVNQEGSGDMYYKGANLIHMVRHIVGDSTFKAMLLEMGRQFSHSVVTSNQIESFMIGFDARTRERLNTHLFDQYLRDTRIPVLEHAVKKKRLWVRWTNCNDSLRMPVRINVDATPATVNCTTQWTALDRRVGKRTPIAVDRAWYVGSRRVSPSKVRKPGERPRNSFELSF